MAQVKRCCFGFCREFKDFALRGNVFDLAIGIVIGTAFTNVVESLVNDIITPPLGFALGGVDFANLTISMKNFVYHDKPPVVIRYGKFLQSIITLIIVALAMFSIIKIVNQLYKIASKQKLKTATTTAPSLEITSEERPTSNEHIKVLREIRDLLAHENAVGAISAPL